jgi:hypothetical protein
MSSRPKTEPRTFRRSECRGDVMMVKHGWLMRLLQFSEPICLAMWITPPAITRSLRAKVDDVGVSAPAAGTGEVEQQPAESEIGGCRLRCGQRVV